MTANLSQEDLADRAGLHRTYVGGVERGERNLALDAMWRLAEALGVRVADLFTDDNASPTSAPEANARANKTRMR